MALPYPPPFFLLPTKPPPPSWMFVGKRLVKEEEEVFCPPSLLLSPSAFPTTISGKNLFPFPPLPPPPSEPISTPKKEVNTVLWCKRQTRPVRVFGRERERRGPRPGQIGSPYIKRW